MFHVGDVVRKLREARGWTNKVLAEKAGLNKMTVSAIENGENYKRDSLQQLAVAFGLTAARLEALLHEWAESVTRPSARRLSVDETALLQVWAELEPDDREHEARRLRRLSTLAGEARKLEAERHKAQADLQAARDEARTLAAQLDTGTRSRSAARAPGKRRATG